METSYFPFLPGLLEVSLHMSNLFNFGQIWAHSLEEYEYNWSLLELYCWHVETENNWDRLLE